MLRSALTILLASVAGAALACSAQDHAADAGAAGYDVATLQTEQSAPMMSAEMLSPDQRAAYEDCLAASQAVAMPWSVIEQQCLENSGVMDGGVMDGAGG